MAGECYEIQHNRNGSKAGVLEERHGPLCISLLAALCNKLHVAFHVAFRCVCPDGTLVLVTYGHTVDT